MRQRQLEVQHLSKKETLLFFYNPIIIPRANILTNYLAHPLARPGRGFYLVSWFTPLPQFFIKLKVYFIMNEKQISKLRVKLVELQEKRNKIIEKIEKTRAELMKALIVKERKKISKK